MGKLASRLAAVLAAGTLLVGLAAPASSAELDKSYHRKWSTGGLGDRGYGIADFKISFYGKRKVYMNGEVKDICPANDKGVYLRLRVHHKNGSITRRLLTDTGGCGGTGILYLSNVRNGKKITHVRGKLCEKNAEGKDRYKNCSGWKRANNPRVR